MVVLGLLILILAVIVAIGVISMTANNVSDAVQLFGYNLDLSRAGVFIFGAIVGALALLGLALLISALRRSSHRRKVAELEHYRYEAESARQERDELIDARERQLKQERELHARHERELREVRESNTTPDVVNETRNPAVDEPRTDVTRSEMARTDAPADESAVRREPLADETRPTVDDSRHSAVRGDEAGHKEGFLHRIFGSPAHRS